MTSKHQDRIFRLANPDNRDVAGVRAYPDRPFHPGERHPLRMSTETRSRSEVRDGSVSLRPGRHRPLFATAATAARAAAARRDLRRRRRAGTASCSHREPLPDPGSAPRMRDRGRAASRLLRVAPAAAPQRGSGWLVPISENRARPRASWTRRTGGGVERIYGLPHRFDPETGCATRRQRASPGFSQDAPGRSNP